MLKKPLFHPTRTYLTKVIESFAPRKANSSRIFWSFPVLDHILWYLMKQVKI